MSACVKLRLFGGFALRDARGEAVSLTLRKTEALIAFLAVGVSGNEQRDRVATLLWSESRQSRALQSLRQARLTLMRDLESHNLAIIEFNRRDIRLDIESLQIDAVEFARLQAAGDPDSLVRAVELYRGDFLAGMDIESEAFDEWLKPTRAWYREQVEIVLERLLALQEEAQAHESSIRTVRHILSIDPLREDMHRRLMRVFARAGHRTSALAAYDACRSLLREELDVAPEEETESLYKEILRSARPGPRRGLPAGFTENRTSVRDAATSEIDWRGPPAGEGAALVPISNLSSSALEVLHIAAICRNDLTLPLLKGMNVTLAGGGKSAVRELTRAGLLQWDAAAQRGTLHDAVRTKIIDGLLPSHRKHLHYAVAVAMEESARTDSRDDDYEIVEHYRRAEKWAPAVRHQLRLAKIEIDLGNRHSAESLLQKVLADIAMLPEHEERNFLEVETQLLRANLAEAAGEIDQAEEILNGIWPTLRQLGPSRFWAGALQSRSRLHFRKGRNSKAYAAICQVHQHCSSGRTDGFWLLAERFAEATEIISSDGGALVTVRQRHPIMGPRSGETEDNLLQALCHAKQDRYAAAYSACDKALRIAEDLPDSTCLIVNLQVLGMIQVWDGDAATALLALDRARDLALERGDLLRQYTTLGYRGFALVAAGQASDGVESLTQALKMAGDLKLQFMTAMFTAWLAEGLMRLGDCDAALAKARTAAALGNERNEPWARSVALRVLGQALSVTSIDGARFVDRILRSAQEMQSSLGLLFESERTADTRADLSRTLH